MSTFATHLRQICNKFAINLLHICNRFAIHLQHICNRFAINLLHICKHLWWNFFESFKYSSFKQVHIAIARAHRCIDFSWLTNSSNHCEVSSIISSVAIYKYFQTVSRDISKIHYIAQIII